MFFSIVLLWLSIRSIFMKCYFAKKLSKSVVSITASVLCLIADASSLTLCTSNFLRSMNVGDQALETNTINSIAISILGISTFIGSLSVCLLWIQLSAVAQISNQKTTKLVLLVIGVSYTIWLVISYVITKQVVWWFILDILYAIILIAFLQKGSAMISSRLRSLTSPFLEKTQIMIKVRPVPKNKDSKKFESLAGLHPPHHGRCNINASIEVNRGKPDNERTTTGRFNTPKKNRERKPFHLRTIQQVKRIKKSANLLSIYYGLLVLSSTAFVATLFFPQVGALTCICAFTMISSQLLVRFILLEYLAGAPNALTKILTFSAEVISQFRQH